MSEPYQQRQQQQREGGGGVCAAREFLAAGIYCGIKETNCDRVDLALVYSPRNCVAAAVFTTNQVKAAPVRVSLQHMNSRKRNICAVVLNSGNANACTGEEGFADALSMARGAAEALQLKTEQVLVCSTGRIGIPLPMEKITPKIHHLAGLLTSEGGRIAAQAIMTSDTHPKETVREFKIRGVSVRLGGMAKGAGMINPHMATMLCLITTDATISASVLRRALKEAVRNSFNCITIDGDMSTNDSVIALANGASECAPISVDSTEYAIFLEALQSVCLELAKMIVLDGEGVSKFVEVEIERARSHLEAQHAAHAVANSFLLKCAWAGNDPNWGRMMDALGYSKAKIQEEKVDIFLNKLPLVVGGIAASTSLASLREAAAQKALHVKIDLKLGKGCHTIFTTDFTEETVRLNLGE